MAHVGGALDAAQLDRVRDHLDHCDTCRELVVVLAKGSEPGKPVDLVATQLQLTALRTAADSHLEIGERFVIEKLLGQGGMGRVFAARDTELDRPVAVKVLRHDLESEELAERLLRESRLMAKLNHPGVVTIYDVGRSSGRVWIAMELIDGTTLAQWLKAKPRDWRAILDVFARAGEGIAAAHAAGLVHRDIKPENILVALDGKRVAVSDFGVARAAATNPQAITHTARVGTPAYMAPEQFAGGDVDARADVFAFGVSLWEALFGERPYQGKSIAELEAALSRGAPEPPKTVPSWVRTAARDAIEPDRDKRTPTIEALLGQLDLRKRARRRTIALVAGALVVGVGGVAFAVVPRVVPASLPATCKTPLGWDDAARGQIKTALQNVPGDVASGVRDRTLAAGDAFAKRWDDSRANACKLDDATRRDAELACLDARKNALASLIARAPSIKRASLMELDAIVEDLPSPTTCGTDAVLIRDGVPALRDLAAMLETKLAEADVTIATGGTAELDALAPQIAMTGSRSLEAERLMLRARALDDMTAFRDAATAAAAAGRDDLAAEAWLQVAVDESQTMNDPKRSSDALALVDAAIVRGGEDPKLRTRYQLAQAQLALLVTKFDDAARLLGIVRDRAPKDAPSIIDDIGATQVSLLTEQGKFDDAAAAARALIDDASKRFGASHSHAVRGHNLLANVMLQQGDMKGALAEMTEALDLVKRGYGEDSDSYGLALRNLGVTLDGVGKTDDALANIHRAREILIKTRGARSFMVGDTFQDEATALSAAQRWEEALPLYEQAIAIYKDAVGEGHFHLAEAMLSYATTLEHTKRKAEAVPTARDAVKIFRDAYGEDSARYAYSRAALGEVLINVGDKRSARVELEAAVAIYAHVDFDPSLVNAATFNLAQALIADPKEHDRAMKLAGEALAFYKQAGPQWQDVVDHIQLWIKQDGKD
ncbi:MAG: serine/threonine-protein kinase [Kofleriaceae bacterium]